MVNRRSVIGAAVLGGGVIAIGGMATRQFSRGQGAVFAPATSGGSLVIPTLYSGERENGIRVFDLKLH